jgi:uncharacterized repeat protein (TIGR03803 family)
VESENPSSLSLRTRLDNHTRKPASVLSRQCLREVFVTEEYGATAVGGACSVGTVFKVMQAGKETVLYSFGDLTTHANTPYAGLVRDAKGNLYGTTCMGGEGLPCFVEMTG